MTSGIKCDFLIGICNNLSFLASNFNNKKYGKLLIKFLFCNWHAIQINSLKAIHLIVVMDDKVESELFIF